LAPSILSDKASHEGDPAHLCGDARRDLEQFQRTRNAPGALYSVAGKDAGALSWDRAPSPAA